MPNYSGTRINSYFKVCGDARYVCLDGGGASLYCALYEHRFAGMQGMRVLGGVALGSEALHAELQRYRYQVLL